MLWLVESACGVWQRVPRQACSHFVAVLVVDLLLQVLRLTTVNYQSNGQESASEIHRDGIQLL